MERAGIQQAVKFRGFVRVWFRYTTEIKYLSVFIVNIPYNYNFIISNTYLFQEQVEQVE